MVLCHIAFWIKMFTSISNTKITNVGRFLNSLPILSLPAVSRIQTRFPLVDSGNIIIAYFFCCLSLGVAITGVTNHTLVLLHVISVWGDLYRRSVSYVMCMAGGKTKVQNQIAELSLVAEKAE